jgi:hypothetical protein
MKIDAILKTEFASRMANPNIKLRPNLSRNAVSDVKKYKQVNFQGKIPGGIKSTGIKLIASISEKYVQFANKAKTTVLGWIASISEKSIIFEEERWNIALTAIGTGLVAPLMIAKNPLAKDKDKDSKYYMAIRQPISAILAVVAQLGICKQSNKYIDKLARSGQLKKYDLSIFKNCKNADERSKIFGALNSIEKVATQLKIDKLNVFKDKVGVLLALMTIPITCTILNWAHPRFIEVFFPELAKDKTTKKEVK